MSCGLSNLEIYIRELARVASAEARPLQTARSLQTLIYELSLSRARSSHFRLSRAHMADGTCTCVHVYMYMHMHMHMHMCVDRVDVRMYIYDMREC